MSEQMRKEFEKWYSDDGAWPDTIERTGSGYMYMGAEAAWRAWQAALVTQPQAPQGGEWQPIESAPEDGTHIMLYLPEIQFVGFNSRAGWVVNAPGLPLMRLPPTHWKPLCAAPKTETPEAGK